MPEPTIFPSGALLGIRESHRRAADLCRACTRVALATDGFTPFYAQLQDEVLARGCRWWVDTRHILVCDLLESGNSLFWINVEVQPSINHQRQPRSSFRRMLMLSHVVRFIGSLKSTTTIASILSRVRVREAACRNIFMGIFLCQNSARLLSYPQHPAQLAEADCNTAQSIDVVARSCREWDACARNPFSNNRPDLRSALETERTQGQSTPLAHFEVCYWMRVQGSFTWAESIGLKVSRQANINVDRRLR